MNVTNDRIVVFIFVVCSIKYAEDQLLQAIKEAYNLDTTPTLTINLDSTVSETTTQMCWFFSVFIH